MGSDLPGEGIEGGREVGGKRGEGGEGKERYVFYWVFGGEAEGGSEQKESLQWWWTRLAPFLLESIAARQGQPPS